MCPSAAASRNLLSCGEGKRGPLGGTGSSPGKLPPASAGSADQRGMELGSTRGNRASLLREPSRRGHPPREKMLRHRVSRDTGFPDPDTGFPDPKKGIGAYDKIETSMKQPRVRTGGDLTGPFRPAGIFSQVIRQFLAVIWEMSVKTLSMPSRNDTVRGSPEHLQVCARTQAISTSLNPEGPVES